MPEQQCIRFRELCEYASREYAVGSMTQSSYKWAEPLDHPLHPINQVDAGYETPDEQQYPDLQRSGMVSMLTGSTEDTGVPLPHDTPAANTSSSQMTGSGRRAPPPPERTVQGYIKPVLQEYNAACRSTRSEGGRQQRPEQQHATATQRCQGVHTRGRRRRFGA